MYEEHTGLHSIRWEVILLTRLHNHYLTQHLDHIHLLAADFASFRLDTEWLNERTNERCSDNFHKIS